MQMRKVLSAEQVGCVAYGIWRKAWPQGDITKQDMRAVWWLKLDCGHMRQCVSVSAPERFECMACHARGQGLLPMDLPTRTETWR